MLDEITYKGLRDLVRQEKSQPGLVRLAPEFTGSLEGFLSAKFTEMESNRNVMQMREFENAVAVIREISIIRQQKILFKAIRSGGTHGEITEMTRSEHELYDRFCAVIEEQNSQLDSLLSRFTSKKAHVETQTKAKGANAQADGANVNPAEDSLRKVRFLKDVPAHIGENSQTFGPFRTGEEGALPQEEANWLLKGKLAETIG